MKRCPSDIWRDPDGFEEPGQCSLRTFRSLPGYSFAAKALGEDASWCCYFPMSYVFARNLPHLAISYIWRTSCQLVRRSASWCAFEKIYSYGSQNQLSKNLLGHDLITGIRGEGLLLAVNLLHSDYVKYAVATAPRFGLVLDYFLFCDSAFRIAPPLTISEDEISWACRQLILLLDDTVKNVKLWCENPVTWFFSCYFQSFWTSQDRLSHPIPNRLWQGCLNNLLQLPMIL